MGEFEAGGGEDVARAHLVQAQGRRGHRGTGVHAARDLQETLPFAPFAFAAVQGKQEHRRGGQQFHGAGRRHGFAADDAAAVAAGFEHEHLARRTIAGFAQGFGDAAAGF
ncbi:MAG: hypothetical protein R3E96_15590 [Planctomycetota bacterium]